MYVALRETFDVYPGNKAVRRFAGERLETFASWPVQNQMAALSCRMVREVPDGDVDAEALFKPEHRQDIEAAKARIRAAAPNVPVNTVVSPEPVEAVAPAAVEDEIEMVEGHACADCDYVGGSARGLAIHRGSAHKK